MRTFLAVPIPEEVRAKVSELIPNLQGGNFKIVKPENYHLTLKFLGEKTDPEINQIKEVLTPITNKFQATLSGLGAFPSPNYVKVIWAGLGDGKENYIGLQKEVDSLLSKLPQQNIRPERDYTPHLTVARVKMVSDKAAVQAFLSTKFSSPPFQIDKIQLMKSELAPGGPVYTELFSIQLPGD